MSPKKKNPTIYDVAELSGVSISTISRALNAPEKLNGETRARVFDAIDRLGFVPKAEARARALRQTGRIGVVTPYFTAPSFVQRLRGVASVLSKSKYELVIYTVDTARRLHGYVSSIPLTGNLDGLIIMSLPPLCVTMAASTLAALFSCSADSRSSEAALEAPQRPRADFACAITS